VLSRPKIQDRFPQLTDDRIAAFLARISNLAIAVKDVPSVFRYERDPDDEPYLNLAIAAKADFLVTRDHDLLDLSREIDPEGRRLRAKAPQLRILDPATLLRSMAAERKPPE
jgi:predicted nucleic acid-binding protein